MGLIYSQENNVQVDNDDCIPNTKIAPSISTTITASETEGFIERCEDNPAVLPTKMSASERKEEEGESNVVDDNHDSIEEGEETLSRLDDNIKPDCNGNKLDEDGDECFVDIEVCDAVIPEVTSQKRKRSSYRIAKGTEENIIEGKNDVYIVDEDTDMVTRKGKRAKQ